MIKAIGGKKDKIELIASLIQGKISKREVVQTMPVPVCIEWSDTDPEENIYVANGGKVNKIDFDRIVEMRAKYE
ncbi:hypothetical protein ACTHQF_06630 [Pedobacter sp. SAFR-022]|uniref:hypothetical protein n=1 Tax=Pedobacter sp. SAFR-022 TaxID=3436861 RepID=UPI003F7DE4BE